MYIRVHATLLHDNVVTLSSIQIILIFVKRSIFFFFLPTIVLFTSALLLCLNFIRTQTVYKIEGDNLRGQFTENISIPNAPEDTQSSPRTSCCATPCITCLLLWSTTWTMMYYRNSIFSRGKRFE